MNKLLILIALLLTALFGSQIKDKPATVQSTEENFSDTYSVKTVIDGDTLIIETPDGEEKVRLIGIDTPEVDPNKGGPECYGKEASKRTKELVEGQSIKVETDSTQGTRDKYDRLLAYVRLSDGAILNETLIKEGYAREYTFNQPYRYQSEFKSAQSQAKSGKRGLWTACAGN